MRTKEFIGGTHQKVTAQRLHIDQVVRGIMHRIDVNLCADAVGGFGDGFNIDDAARNIRGLGDRDEACFGGDLLAKPGNIQRTIRLQQGDLMHGDVFVVGRLLPTGYVGVVIQLGDDNFIAGLPVATNDPAEVERQRGHIHAKTILSGEGAFKKARTDSLVCSITSVVL